MSDGLALLQLLMMLLVSAAGFCGTLMIPVLFIGGFITLAFQLYKPDSALRRRLQQFWYDAAEDLGIDVHPTGRRVYLSGVVHDVPLEVRIVGDGKFAKLVFRTEAPSLPTAVFTATPHAMARLIRGASIFNQPANLLEIGDPAFDEHYLIGARDPDAARSWLVPLRLDQLRTLLETFDEVQVGGGSVRAEIKFDTRSVWQLAAWAREVVFATELFVSAEDTAAQSP